MTVLNVRNQISPDMAQSGSDLISKIETVLAQNVVGLRVANVKCDPDEISMWSLAGGKLASVESSEVTTVDELINVVSNETGHAGRWRLVPVGSSQILDNHSLAA